MLSDQISPSVVSDSLRPHESQHARPPRPSPTPGVHPDSRPSSQWCHPAISSPVVPFSSCPQSLPASVFSNESTLRMRWPKYWSFSFSISPPKEIPGLISFRMDWLDLLYRELFNNYCCLFYLIPSPQFIPPLPPTISWVLSLYQALCYFSLIPQMLAVCSHLILK